MTLPGEGTNGLERLKLEMEIDKLRAEAAGLRRTWPTWIAALPTVIVGAITLVFAFHSNFFEGNSRLLEANA